MRDVELHSMEQTMQILPLPRAGRHQPLCIPCAGSCSEELMLTPEDLEITDELAQEPEFFIDENQQHA